MGIFGYTEIDLVDPDGEVRGGYLVRDELVETMLELLDDEGVLYIVR